MKVIFPDGTVYSQEGGSGPPTPTHRLKLVPTPTFGTFAFPGHSFFRIIHDNLNPEWNNRSRTLDPNETHRSTNEMYVPRRWYLRDDGVWRVDQYSKTQFWPEASPAWLDYFKYGMTSRQWSDFCTKGFGWRDSGGGSGTPSNPNIYSFVMIGGNLIKAVGNWRQWTLFAVQDTNKPPVLYSYLQRPDLVFKQGLVANWANKASEPDTWLVDKGVVGGVGDLYIPSACPSGVAAILTSEIRPVAPLPWNTSSNGVPVTFDEFCFQGSSTLGKERTLGWCIIEEMEITGNPNDHSVGGTWDDLRRYTDEPVCAVWPVPVIGWQRSYTFMEKVVNFFRNILS